MRKRFLFLLLLIFSILVSVLTLNAYKVVAASSYYSSISDIEGGKCYGW